MFRLWRGIPRPARRDVTGSGWPQVSGNPTMAGAVYIGNRHNNNMAGGPPMATHHITADTLHGDGTRAATLDGVSQYLINMGYEPHVVIDPFTGLARQLLSPLDSGYALEHPAGQPETNRQGDVNIQVEWLFTPGTVYNGRRYAQLADTPMLGLDAFLAWCDSWGVSRAGPYMAPGDRDPGRWRAGGHRGHYNAPANSHVDPISPIPAILEKASKPTPPTPPERKRMLFVIRFNDETGYWVSDGITRRPTNAPAYWLDRGAVLVEGIPAGVFYEMPDVRRMIAPTPSTLTAEENYQSRRVPLAAPDAMASGTQQVR